jgi:hypothetical protein
MKKINKSHIDSKYHPIKIILTTILCLITLSSFLTFSTLNHTDRDTITLNTQMDHKDNIFIVNGSDGNSKTDFTESQKTVLEKYDAHPTFDFGLKLPLAPEYENKTSDIPILSYMKSMKIVEMWNSDMFQQDERIKENSNANTPSGVYSIAISSIMADCIVKYGYYNLTDVNDLIMRQIGPFSIRNIYKTKDEEIIKEKLNNSNSEDLSNLFSYSQLIYACEGFTKNYEELYVVLEDSNTGWSSNLPEPKIGEYYLFDTSKKTYNANELLQNLQMQNNSYQLSSPYKEKIDQTYPYIGTNQKANIVLPLLISILCSILSLVLLYFLIIKENPKFINCRNRILNQAAKSSFITILLMFLTLLSACISIRICNSISQVAILSFQGLAWLEVLGTILLIAVAHFIFYARKETKK